MLDAIGQELQVGDEVVFVSSPGGIRHLVKGFISAVNGKTVSVAREKDSKYAGWARPNQVAKISSPKVIPEDSVVISKEKLVSYRKAYYHLNELQALGVDNWEGYFNMQFDDEGYPEEEDEDED
jgi:hypothetical protein